MEDERNHPVVLTITPVRLCSSAKSHAAGYSKSPLLRSMLHRDSLMLCGPVHVVRRISFCTKILTKYVFIYLHLRSLWCRDWANHGALRAGLSGCTYGRTQTQLALVGVLHAGCPTALVVNRGSQAPHKYAGFEKRSFKQVASFEPSSAGQRGVEWHRHTYTRTRTGAQCLRYLLRSET